LSREIGQEGYVYCRACHGTGVIIDQQWLSATLKAERTALVHAGGGTTLRATARIMGISASYLCDLENGRRNWTQELATRYSKAIRNPK
jgi:hypothetical protein